jgi:hypothetical protein
MKLLTDDVLLGSAVDAGAIAAAKSNSVCLISLRSIHLLC